MPKIKSVAVTVIEEDWGFGQTEQKRRTYLSYDFYRDLEIETNEIIVQGKRIKPLLVAILLLSGDTLYLIDPGALDIKEPKYLIETGWRLSSEEERKKVFGWIAEACIYKKEQKQVLQQSIRKRRQGLLGATLELISSFIPIGAVLLASGKLILKLCAFFTGKRTP